MGQPAARVGDQTGHGTPLGPGPGCPTVMIGGKPAWRATSDTHACPLSDGPKPHGGGVVAKGSATVLIGGMPAARVGDTTGHGTPLSPGPGCPTVLIGGKPAWRAGGDTHVCPLSDGPKPHVGGPVLPPGMVTKSLPRIVSPAAGIRGVRQTRSMLIDPITTMGLGMSGSFVE